MTRVAADMMDAVPKANFARRPRRPPARGGPPAAPCLPRRPRPAAAAVTPDRENDVGSPCAFGVASISASSPALVRRLAADLAGVGRKNPDIAIDLEERPSRATVEALLLKERPSPSAGTSC